MLHFNQLKKIIQGQVISSFQDLPVAHLLLDSRKIISPATSVFFAIRGVRHDGHQYIQELYKKGIRQFVVEQPAAVSFSDANVIQVENSVYALQCVAAWYRNQFRFPVVGITGSNGKTMVKEWLFQLLNQNFNIVRSPKSYNSQIGVPLSVWQMNHQHNLGIFEAGISLPGEMRRLQSVIRPDIGIFTNIGTAHDEGFTSREEKIKEKLQLFINSHTLFYCKEHLDDSIIHQYLPEIQTFTWSYQGNADICIQNIEQHQGKTQVTLLYRNNLSSWVIPFIDTASLENIFHCMAVLFYFKIEAKEIQKRIDALHRVAMRLELKEGIHDCYIIDDTYNNDLVGLSIAVNFLDQQKHKENKAIILSDVLESGKGEEDLYQEIAHLLREKHIGKIIGIGSTISKHKDFFPENSMFYEDTAQFLQNFHFTHLTNEIVLIKGARKFQFEKIVAQLQKKVHRTILEVNLDALSSNLNFYKSKLQADTRLMVMVKAFAYGSGSAEIANLLQFHRVDYLAVAYADEGVALREHGITLPVMVMNPVAESFDKLIQYNLEPEIYSFKILQEFHDYLQRCNASSRIHLKMDTGMRRLGFEGKEINQLVHFLNQAKGLVSIASVFTHLAGADESVHNEFSLLQLQKFQESSLLLEKKLGYKVLKHALNSAGIIRFPEWQMDMVRLGIGLYGVEASATFQNEIQSVGTLKTIISQIKKIDMGETVGYSRKGKAVQPAVIATIAIGYADGYDRRFGNGVGKVLVKGHLCPVIGNICMDMTMIDITGIDAREGEEVIIFGKDLPVADMAKSIGTIPYEILTSVSERVKRVFYTE